MMLTGKRYIQHYKTLTKLGMPIVAGQLGVIVLGFADTLMVGRYSIEGLAAASFVNNLFSLAIVFSTGFSYGLTPVIGGLFGRLKALQGGSPTEPEDTEEALYGQIGGKLKSALWVNAAKTVLLLLIMGALYLNISRLGQPEELLPLMKPYFLVLLCSLLFVMLFNAFKQFAESINDTVTPMCILIGGNLFNIFGNWLLIYGKLGCPEMGLLGAGISTLASRILMLVAFAVIFLTSRRYRKYRRGFTQSRTGREDFLQLNRLGMPVGLQMGMEASSFSLSTVMVGWLGTLPLAAHQVMLTVSQLGFMMYYGMSAAVAVRTSNYMGQGNREEVRNTAAAGFHLVLAMAALASVVVLLFRNQLGIIFADSEEVALIVAQLVIPFVIYQFGDAMQSCYANALRGISDVKMVTLYAFIAYFVVSLPSAYLFGFIFDWGLMGIWFSFPLGLTTAGLLFYTRFRRSLKARAGAASGL